MIAKYKHPNSSSILVRVGWTLTMRTYPDFPYEELKGKEGRKNIYKLANARKRMATDIGRVTAVKDKDGTLLRTDF